MSEWNVEILPEAKIELAQLAPNVRFEALDVVDDLREDPFPSDAEPLRGSKSR